MFRISIKQSLINREKIITDIIFQYIQKHRLQTEIFIMISVVVYFLQYIPYLNLIFSPDLVIAIIFWIFISLFNVNYRIIINTVLIQFLLGMSLTILGMNNIAENNANIQYMLLWIGIYKYTKSLWT